jgi:ATP-dependent Clp protease ATP-binding subunit ClpA
MFDRFTDRARSAIGQAKAAAQRLHHGSMGTEHLLLGLLHDESCTAVKILFESKADPNRVRSEVVKIVRGSRTPQVQGMLPFTPRAKRVLELAVEEAVGLGHRELGTEHLLLGLIGEAEGVAAKVLTSLGLELGAVRSKVRELRSGATAGTATGAASATPVDEPDPLLRLSDRARKVVRLAKDEAKRLKHDHVRTEHLLLGLVAEGSGIAVHVLKRLNVDLHYVRSELERIVGRSPSIEVPRNPSFAPSAKRALELAVEEADGLGHNYIGTEHLLLGLLREGEGIAGLVLRNLGVSLATTREKIVEFIGGASGSAD